MCFNLVAELWLLLLLSVVALVTFVVVFAPTSVETAIKDAVNSGRDEMCVQFPMLCRRTTFSTTLAISTANSFGADNSQFGEQSTMSTAILATTTTSGVTSVPNNDGSIATSFNMDGLVTDHPVLTTIRTMLATSTDKAEERRMVELLRRAMKRSHEEVETAMERLEQMSLSLQQDMGPAEMIKHLRDIGLLDDSDNDDDASLFEVNASALVRPNATPMMHDPWWYEDIDAERDDDDSWTTGGRLAEHVNRRAMNLTGVNDSQSVHVNNSRMYADPSQLFSMHDPFRRLSNKLSVSSWSVKHRLHVIYVFLGTCLILASVGMMHAGNRQQQGHHGPRMGPNYTADVGTATLKTPPSWSYENSHQYSLRSWLSDVILWSNATDLEPDRHAPAVALVVTGAARDLIRELQPQQLREGVWEQGVHVSGLLLLCRTLARHYAPMETELQTRSMAELVGFSRLNGENMDAALTRFEVLKHRAIQRGGFAMNAATMSYILLNGLRLRPEQWDRMLLPLDGEMPVNDQQFQQLFERLRRVGRMNEGAFMPPNRQGATGEVGAFYFPSFGEPAPPMAPGYQTYYGGPPSMNADAQAPMSPPDVPMSSGVNMSASFAVMSEDEDQCPRCGMFYADDEFSSGTETDDGETDNEVTTLYGNLSEDSAKLGNELYEAYLVAKRRWRRFSNKPPRRYRRNHVNKFRHKSNMQKMQRYGTSYASFLPPGAFAAHRGPGGKASGKGRNGRQNPRGRDGQPLKCFKCGSTEHLAKRCSKPDSQGQQQMAMLTGIGGSNLQFFARGVSHQSDTASRPSSDVGASHVFTTMRMQTGELVSRTFEAESIHSSAPSSKRSFFDDLESLRSASSNNKRRVDTAVEDKRDEYADNPEPRFPPPTEPAPTAQQLQMKAAVVVNQPVAEWTSFMVGSLSSSSSAPAQPRMSSTEALLSGLESSRSSPSQAITADDAQDAESPSRPTRPTKQKQKEIRSATTLQLSQLLSNMPGSQPDPESSSAFPWWEMVREDNPNINQGRPTYHSMRTCTPDGRSGLLVDPGAHDNLAGSETIEAIEQQLRTHARKKLLDEPLHVSGVGKSAQCATTAVSVDFDLGMLVDGHDSAPELGCTYTAPVIPNSQLPMLLGLKSLRAKRAILDTHGRLLILPGEGGVEFRVSPGTLVLQLEDSESGHLILPMRPPMDPVDYRTVRSDRRTMEEHKLNFNTHCRAARTPSPTRTPVHATRGPYQKDGHRILTGVQEPSQPINSQQTRRLSDVHGVRSSEASRTPRTGRNSAPPEPPRAGRSAAPPEPSGPPPVRAEPNP